MRHVFGYVIPNFSFDEHISQTMKEDYLVMANLQRQYEAAGDVLVFYIVTMNTDITLKMQHLAHQYKHKSSKLNLIFLSPDQNDIQYATKKIGVATRDLGGILVVANPSDLTTEKRTSLAKIAGRRFLLRYLKHREDRVTEVTKRYEIPPGIDWDFYANG